MGWVSWLSGHLPAGKSVNDADTSSLLFHAGFLFSLLFTQLVLNLYLPSVESRSRVEGNELFNPTLAAGVQEPTHLYHKPRKATNQGMLLLR